MCVEVEVCEVGVCEVEVSEKSENPTRGEVGNYKYPFVPIITILLKKVLVHTSLCATMAPYIFFTCTTLLPLEVFAGRRKVNGAGKFLLGRLEVPE